MVFASVDVDEMPKLFWLGIEKESHFLTLGYGKRTAEMARCTTWQGRSSLWVESASIIIHRCPETTLIIA